ncbi:MAG: HAMP domain-containing histidine kinase [bacterium]|nr:HAMP domain-containing histidine kinase [bacterium]
MCGPIMSAMLSSMGADRMKGFRRVSSWVSTNGRMTNGQAGDTVRDSQFTHSYIRFWVRDNGKGLAPDEQERLFTPFTRLDQVRAKGNGLGLSIIRRFINRLGCQVGVESATGQGSTFYFTLPGTEKH